MIYIANKVDVLTRAPARSIDYRGVFTTNANGDYLLHTVKPIGYSIPMDGPVARWSRRRRDTACGRRIFSYRELVTALYLRDDPHLADDVVLGSSGDLAVDIDEICPIEGLPSISFDMQLSRESAVDRTADASASIRP